MERFWSVAVANEAARVRDPEDMMTDLTGSGEKGGTWRGRRRDGKEAKREDGDDEKEREGEGESKVEEREELTMEKLEEREVEMRERK